jgi:hypothetical protein
MLELLQNLPGRTADGHKIGLFQCSCGEKTTVAISRVKNGYTKSCGCFAVETSRLTNRKHGMRGSPEYSSWLAMKARCLDPDNKDYPRWGALGVTVYPEWAISFEAFYRHIGPRPNGMTLDRIGNDKGYEPGNVRWATASEQAANRRDTWVVEIDGVQHLTVEQAARVHGVSATTITRWCEGFYNPRRAHQANQGHTPARPGCRKWRKYAD